MGFSLDLLIFSFLYGAIGFAYFSYGKKMAKYIPIACGLILMVFPYFTSNVMAFHCIGGIGVIVPWVIKD